MMNMTNILQIPICLLGVKINFACLFCTSLSINLHFAFEHSITELTNAMEVFSSMASKILNEFKHARVIF